MRRVVLAALVVAAVSGCSSSSNNTSDPVSACKSAINAVCTKLFNCYPSEAAQVYTNVGTCETTLSATGCTTANTTCPTGKTYNSSNASQCITDYSKQSCTDVGNGTVPTSCSNICT